MTKLRQFLLLLVISAALFSVGQTTIKEFGDHVASVRVISGLPEKSETMTIECSFNDKSLGIRDLGAGEEYSWNVNVEEKAVYYCEATWGRQIGSWHAYQPRRDANHATVYWLVKPNGFFLSWDNSTWIRRSTWESE